MGRTTETTLARLQWGLLRLSAPANSDASTAQVGLLPSPTAGIQHWAKALGTRIEMGLRGKDGGGTRASRPLVGRGLLGDHLVERDGVAILPDELGDDGRAQLMVSQARSRQQLDTRGVADPEKPDGDRCLGRGAGAGLVCSRPRGLRPRSGCGSGGAQRASPAPARPRLGAKDGAGCSAGTSRRQQVARASKRARLNAKERPCLPEYRQVQACSRGSIAPGQTPTSL